MATLESIAIIGASNDRSRFANKAVRVYLDEGLTVYPVHPKEQSVEGLKTYRSVLDIPGRVDIASFYVPPAIGEKVALEVIRKGIPRVYLNPGSESPELFRLLDDAGIEVVLACSIRAAGKDPGDY